jgi:uncharacterized membrane protein YccC
MRAVRATVVIPGLLALTFKVIGSPQMALFATFGGFATLIFAAFGGTRRDKAIAHLELAVVGSIALVIGTAVSGVTWLAAVVTIPVAFAIFFAGVIGPKPASGVSAALLAYVLPVGSAGTVATIPDRLAGWWLASAVGTAAVLLLSPKTPGDRLRSRAAAAATAFGHQLDAAVRGQATDADQDAAVAAKHALIDAFAATPYRPTGLATADQALTSVVQVLEWCSSLISDALEGHLDPDRAAPPDRELACVAADVLSEVGALLSGADVTPDLDRLERARAASTAYQRDLAHERDLGGDPEQVHAYAANAFHAQAIAVAVRTAASDALIATRRADPETIAVQRRSWYGGPEGGPPSERRLAAASGVIGIVARHASFRSVWFLNATRGAVALAAAVAIADVSGVQHAFWVVLGTLSVLRTNATSTGSTALRALAGTAAGFAIGAALLLAIGTGPTALWVALPIAVLVASYAPGTAPFAVGQAAFTVTVLVLYNLLAPAGWKVGLLRIQDVAIGCAVSLVIGVLFWPRGASGLVANDLSDAFRRGSAYLIQAVDFALGLRAAEPDTAVAAVTAGIRLDDALRGYFAEQGSKRLPREDLWRLVMGTTRLRLTAHSLAGVRGRAPHGHADEARAVLQRRAAQLAGFYDEVAAEVGHTRPHDRPVNVEVPPGMMPATAEPTASGRHPHLFWVREHLHHLASHADLVTGPAAHLARLRSEPWWR